jgi:acetyltransferase-like isoleucine patch superfamily enzyme
MKKTFIKKWEAFWMRRSGWAGAGRLATWLATRFSTTYFGRHHLAWIHSRGYVSYKATIRHADLRLGENIFVDDYVILYQYHRGGAINIGAGSSLHRGCILQTGEGASILIGESTHVQPQCIFSAFVSPIRIGNYCQIAPNCSFYSYNHGTEKGIHIQKQPLVSKGGIRIGDDVWLGTGVIVLDGVQIGNGAVIGAGSVVTKAIPENSIAIGNPAKVVNDRKGSR